VSEPILKAEEFLTVAGREEVRAAIQAAEHRTSAEIRVHLDDFIADNALDHAAFVFEELDMHRTEDRNGVLIYVSVMDRKVAVIGDSGINTKVEHGFWNEVLVDLQERFKSGEHSDGLVQAVHAVGEKLSTFFPFKDGDRNELSDDVSIGT
jgi:uncharacterized membrane protein